MDQRGDEAEDFGKTEWEKPLSDWYRGFVNSEGVLMEPLNSIVGTAVALSVYLMYQIYVNEKKASSPSSSGGGSTQAETPRSILVSSVGSSSEDPCSCDNCCLWCIKTRKVKSTRCHCCYCCFREKLHELHGNECFGSCNLPVDPDDLSSGNLSDNNSYRNYYNSSRHNNRRKSAEPLQSDIHIKYDSDSDRTVAETGGWVYHSTLTTCTIPTSERLAELVKLHLPTPEIQPHCSLQLECKNAAKKRPPDRHTFDEQEASLSKRLHSSNPSDRDSSVTRYEEDETDKLYTDEWEWARMSELKTRSLRWLVKKHTTSVELLDYATKLGISCAAPVGSLRCMKVCIIWSILVEVFHGNTKRALAFFETYASPRLKKQRQYIAHSDPPAPYHEAPHHLLNEDTSVEDRSVGPFLAKLSPLGESLNRKTSLLEP